MVNVVVPRSAGASLHLLWQAAKDLIAECFYQTFRMYNTFGALSSVYDRYFGTVKPFRLVFPWALLVFTLNLVSKCKFYKSKTKSKTQTGSSRGGYGIMSDIPLHESAGVTAILACNMLLTGLSGTGSPVCVCLLCGVWLVLNLLRRVY